MPDPYPEEFTIEINRPGLARYLRRAERIRIDVVLGTLGAFGGLFYAAAWVERIEASAATIAPLLIPALVVAGAALGALLGTFLTPLVYAVLSRKEVRRQVESLHVAVEGPYLRIRSQSSRTSDRKLHFRSIVDYSTIQDRLARRCGVELLQLTTMAGGQHTLVLIPAVEDCLEVRDTLAEVDRLREFTYST